MDDWQDAMITEDYIKDLDPAGQKKVKKMTEISPRDNARMMSVAAEKQDFIVNRNPAKEQRRTEHIPNPAADRRA